MTTHSFQPQLTPLPAGHPALTVIRQCLEIASGTIAVLIDSGSPAEADAVRASWILFLATHPEGTAACRNWMEAWHWFWDD